MTIPAISILFLMLLGHLIADYTLQGWLADGKQKSWWDKQLKGSPDSTKGKYRDDYRAALVCHSLYWSIIVCLPLVFHQVEFAFCVVGNSAIHYLVDDAKANKRSINLVTDQTLHLIQILSAWIMYVCVTH